MATFTELQKRIRKQGGVRARLGTEEILIEDDRGLMRPGDFIEQKLRAAQDAGEFSPGTTASEDEEVPPPVPPRPR